jgi:hypothetical protein
MRARLKLTGADSIGTRLTYANVMATIALFLALGGVSYASLSIGTRQIRNNSVRSVDVRDGSLRGFKDIRRDTVDGTRVNESSLGEVPRAASARQADQSDHAANADRAASAANADRAATADSAGVAERAGTAGFAASADTVDGRSAACPAGTSFYLGQCFETSPRPDPGFSIEAAQDCADEGRYLPSPLQLLTFAARPGIVLQGGELTDSLFENNDGSAWVMAVEDDGDFARAPANADARYRCVAPLVR